jgi:hypothetical protein
MGWRFQNADVTRLALAGRGHELYRPPQARRFARRWSSGVRCIFLRPLLTAGGVVGWVIPRRRGGCCVHRPGASALGLGAIVEIAKERGLAVIEDAGQAHGARYRERRAGPLGDAAAFSFYPAKNAG